jgi:hypothetical protein
VKAGEIVARVTSRKFGGRGEQETVGRIAVAANRKKLEGSSLHSFREQISFHGLRQKPSNLFLL